MIVAALLCILFFGWLIRSAWRKEIERRAAFWKQAPLAHIAMWDTALSEEQIIELAKVI